MRTTRAAAACGKMCAWEKRMARLSWATRATHLALASSAIVPPRSMQWTYLSTAHLHILPTGEVLEHALSIVSLMGHDQCTSALEEKGAGGWASEKGIPSGHLLPPSKHMAAQSSKSALMTLHARCNLILVPFLKTCFTSQDWEVDRRWHARERRAS